MKIIKSEIGYLAPAQSTALFVILKHGSIIQVPESIQSSVKSQWESENDTIQWAGVQLSKKDIDHLSWSWGVFRSKVDDEKEK